jgi:SpoVK/Ycf46/Vps4 family AAA+-type ATPase
MYAKNLDDLLCDFNYVANSMQIVDSQLIDIPLFYTKQLIKEYCIFPLGSQTVKSNSLGFCSALFYGPSGTGKTHAAISIAHHTNALFMDLSPNNLERFSKQDLTKMIATAFRVAKNKQPAVIYFDNAEQIFLDSKKVKKGAIKNPNATRLRKILLSYKNIITPEMKILIIGCTNNGWNILPKDLNLMFDRSFYFALPSFSDRFKIWKNEIKSKLGKVYDLEYDVLAHMSANFSAESVKNILIVDNIVYKLYFDKTKN